MIDAKYSLIRGVGSQTYKAPSDKGPDRYVGTYIHYLHLSIVDQWNYQ